MLEICTLAFQLKSITLEDKDNYYFVFHNISNDKNAVGSPFRNYVAFLLYYCDFLQNKIVNFISFNLSRTGSQVTCRKSIVYKLKLPMKTKDFYTSWVGWEKNERDKMGPKLANMKNTLDPSVIAENAVDLNLKLMKWNLLPSIDLDNIKKTKCLLLGAGTLGCSVARTLLGWGVRDITFVDNSTVSFSNPVRQSLFTYQDSVDMKSKSKAAADNLKNIFPGVNSVGHQLTIPMPGHSVGESLLEQTKESVKKLTQLIKDHDAIFLLLDSRESRWLPTLIGNVENKILINAALGFDSYLVMRHGVYSQNDTIQASDHPEGCKVITGNNLACYFCCDVTAPGDSLKGRTLDQQCTVTRPGVSQIAGALAVELLISVLQHKHGVLAPAYYSTAQTVPMQEMTASGDSVLGLVPHSIRGFLSSFEQILPATEKYKNCVACSDLVINEYKEKQMEFLLNVFNSSKHLEDVALLTEMFKDTDFEEVLEFSDEDFSA
ncbi:unnamed protein product [Acanthoscelides obtectus]|nr:unnamed protein product [Acanthoscelides obtectus]CAK1625748.1 Ubiquitin-like modifier-activating enzyme ATG7 [Acanthoscelides obtectus]